MSAGIPENKDLKKYRAFGLTISSELELPGLSQGDGEVEVEILLGAVPARLDAPIIGKTRFQATQREFLMHTKKFGSFYLTDGSRIVVQLNGETDPEGDGSRQYLLGSVFGALLFQRGFLPLHGSALSFPDGRCFILTGKSGAGKSTLAAAFLDAGCRMLSDDVCSIHCGSDTPIVYPSYPQQKLWKDSADLLEIDTGNLKFVPARDGKKYYRPVPVSYRSESSPLAVVYELVLAENIPGDRNATIERLSGTEKFLTLAKNTYRLWFAKYLGVQVPHFMQCSRLASTVQVSRITRKTSGNTIGELRDIVMADFNGLS
ncbi:MAG TPA: hypothetical protein VN445_08580 [Rectinemataceae bacterium]|nr:hypothetical protein [Rectinemataceae bacterium]